MEEIKTYLTKKKVVGMIGLIIWVLAFVFTCLKNTLYAGQIIMHTFGYFTYPKFWGNGYTSEAMRRVLKFAFADNDVYRVTTGCLAENKGSERVMQKNGLIKEAEHIDYEWHDGKLKTRVEYRLLKPEWEYL